MAAPIGNKNATKNRPFAEAINRAIAQDDGKRLRSIAEALLSKAAEGDISAIKEFADRVDGKVIQAIEQETYLVADVAVSERPKLSKEEWLATHGLGTTTRPAK